MWNGRNLKGNWRDLGKNWIELTYEGKNMGPDLFYIIIITGKNQLRSQQSNQSTS